jgi:hypothetical protein
MEENSAPKFLSGTLIQRIFLFFRVVTKIFISLICMLILNDFSQSIKFRFHYIEWWVQVMKFLIL